jgi:hypothetical protein
MGSSLLPRGTSLAIKSAVANTIWHKNQAKSLLIQQALDDALRMLSNEESVELLGADRVKYL